MFHCYFAGFVRTSKGLTSMWNQNELVGIFVDGVPLEKYSGQNAAGSVFQN